MRPTFFDPAVRAEAIARLRRLTPSAPRRWGKMSAPQMVAHLTDQMSHCLGDTPCTPERSYLRLPGVRYLAIYWVPWPKGRSRGPADAFLTQPVEWDSDLRALIAKVERFGTRDPAERWPDHALMGRMRGEDWGVLCAKHFDHHLRQFGV
ncbi:MAG TPA: DUF1569 domain-containing protein [Thermoanaerobaculia bacterium]|nr:DUF1569 domain-containing protein [Thermoanaerobaculia bacterium]